MNANDAITNAIKICAALALPGLLVFSVILGIAVARSRGVRSRGVR